MKKLLFVASILCVLSNAFAARANEITTLDANTSAFAMFDAQRQDLKMDNWRAAHEQLPPFSTFKMINSLIAIDANVVASDSARLSFDRSRYPVQKWWPKNWHEKPLTLREAMQNSAVPIFRQLATQIGPQRMQTYLNQMNYGNRDISSGIDNFWLDGSLKISAVEQIDVFQRILKAQTPITAASIEKWKKVIEVEPWNGLRNFAKTGVGQLNHYTSLGWYVGFLEDPKKPQNRYYFAGFVTGKRPEEVAQKRIDYAHAQLQKFIFPQDNAAEKRP